MSATGSRIAVAAAALVATATALAPSANAQHCEVIACSRECGWLPGGGQHCRTVCKRRCWHPRVRYESPTYTRNSAPQYQSRYVAPVLQRRPPQRPADPTALFIVLGGAAVLILAIVATASGGRAAVDAMHKKTDETRADSAQTEALTSKAASTADEIDAYIAARLAVAYRAARDSLPETEHD